MKIKIICFVLLVSFISNTGCIKEELAFDVIESPVLIEFDETESIEDMLMVSVTVFELDKSEILDNRVGIVSTPINGLALSVFINENTLVGELITDDQGAAELAVPLVDIESASKLEWTGEHNGVAFRIYKNI